MEQFDSSEEASSRVLEQQQRNDEQQCPSCAAELTEASVWTTAVNETDYMALGKMTTAREMYIAFSVIASKTGNSSLLAPNAT